MKRELTEAERQRLGLVSTGQSEIHQRGWTNDQIKQAISDKGFSIVELEKVLQLPARSINQSFQRRFPVSDKKLAAFLDVHESTIWPNRYFVNGVAIASAYHIETKSDEVLAKLNADVSKPAEITVVHDWYGDDGKPVISKFTPPPPKMIHETNDQPTNADGTVNHPFYDEPIAPDVPARADERSPVTEIVTLPVGMIIDVK